MYTVYGGDDENVPSGKYLSVYSIDPIDGDIWCGRLGKALNEYILIPISHAKWGLLCEYIESKIEEEQKKYDISNAT